MEGKYNWELNSLKDLRRNFERFCYVNRSKGIPNLMLYITLGTLGTKYYTYRENNMTTDKFDDDNSILHTLDTQTFGKVVVDKDSITFTGYKFNRETGKIEAIGTSKVSTFNYKLMVILLSTLIPGIAIIGVGTGLGIFFAKKKKAN